MRRRDQRDLEEDGREKEVEITDSIALFHLHVPATLLTRSLQGVHCRSRHVVLYIAAIFMQSLCCSEVLNSAASMYMIFMCVLCFYYVFYFIFICVCVFVQVFERWWIYLNYPVWCVLIVYAAIHLLLVYTYNFEHVTCVWQVIFNHTVNNTKGITDTDL